jgi:hypothetical protein
MRIVHLGKYRNRDLVAVVRALLDLAEEGTATGLAFVVKLGQADHRGGMAGDYRRHPDEALSATFRLERLLMQEQAPFDIEEART